MYGNLAFLDGKGAIEKGKRIYVGDTKQRNEAWLRDTLFEHPDIIPVDEIDATFGSMIPLCKEMRTDAGAIDAVFINSLGRLAIVECKLWKNPQARREVVAQTLHYISALTNWTYADLQRQVAAAVGHRGNIPYEVARAHSGGKLRERDFVDSVSRALRDGRFLVLLAGDGIREGIQSLTELVNRNATKAFTFGLIEVALYQFGKGRLAIQPRVLAATETLTRQMTIINTRSDTGADVTATESDAADAEPGRTPRGGKAHLRKWWEPILRMKFDDPEQEPPFWVATNNAVINTPFPGIQIKAFAMVGEPRVGVFLTGTRLDNRLLIREDLARDRQSLLRDLPTGTTLNVDECELYLSIDTLTTDRQRQAWIEKTLNEFANALRPRLREWYRKAET